MQLKSTFKNGLVMKSFFAFALILLSFLQPTFAQVQLDEGFNTAVPLPTGWISVNKSTPAGTVPNWIQGNNAGMNSFDGPANAFIAATYNSIAGAGTISNWLFTPVLNIKNGDVLTFYTRVPLDAFTGQVEFADNLQVRMSTSGASTNVGADATTVGDFSTLLVETNPDFDLTSYPFVWTKYTVTVSGVPTPTTGRFAFRYYVEDGGPDGANSSLIGLDRVTFATPCTGTPAPGNTISSVTSICQGVSFNLSIQNVTPVASYQWQTSTSSTGPWTDITGATNATYTATQSAATWYRVLVTCPTSAATTPTTPVQVTMNPLLSCYCIPPTTTDCSDADVILNVKIGTLNNTSTCSVNGYTDYSVAVPVTDVVRGASNPIAVTTGASYIEAVAVWIDYNKNGVFDTNEFTYLGTTAAGSNGVHNGSIAIPATALTGTTRMRVKVQYSQAITAAQACTAAYLSSGEFEDYTVNIIPCVVSSVTTNPPATTNISCSGTGTITTTISGSLNQYQWQVLATGAGAVWTDVANGAQYSGVTTNTLTITNALPTINGYQYRVRYSGGCTSPSVTTVSTLNVGALAPTVTNTLPINRCTTDAPTAITIATPVGLAALSTTTSAAALHINIPDDNDDEALENDHFISNNLTVAGIPSGAVITGFNVKLNITHSWVGDLIMVLKAPNGKIINLAYALSGTGGAAGSTGFTNTVISSTGTALLSSGSNPYTATFRLDNAGPSAAGFTPTGPLGFDPNTTVLADMYQGNGVWTLALYDLYPDGTATNFLENWQLNISYLAPPAGIFTPATGLFTDPAGTTAYVAGTLASTVYANPAASTTYSATVNTAVCGAGTVSIPVNVGSPLSGTSTVANVSGCQGGNVTFSSTAPTGGLNATLQWQISTDAGVTWTNIAGATTATYTITNVNTTMTGNRFRVVRTVASCGGSTLTSSAGILTVNLLSVLNLTAAPTTAVFPGITTSLVVAVNPAPTAGTTYTWFRNGAQVNGATTNTITGLDVDDLGTYTVRVVDGNGCSTLLSNAVTIRDSATTTLFIYPNPSKGQFHVRYHDISSSPTYQGPRTLTIYDSKGSRVYAKSYPATAPYTDMFVDLSNHGKGVFSVELTDFNGNRIKTGRVLIQ